MKNTDSIFGIGDRVNVEARGSDNFHDFTGIIRKFHDSETVTVEDQDGDCWDCNLDQISFNSDID